MKRLRLIVTSLFATAPVILGCGPRTPAEVESSPTQASIKEQIATMYVGYRRDAFPSVREVTVRELLELRADRRVVLVDCREADEQTVSMIDGAITQRQFDADPKRYEGSIVIPYCTIGYRSGLYTSELTERGIAARNLVGGVLAWAHNGEPFTDNKGESTMRVHVYGADWDLLPPTHESIFPNKPSP